MWVSDECTVKPEISEQLLSFTRVWGAAEDIEQVAEQTGLSPREARFLAEILRTEMGVPFPVLPNRVSSHRNNTEPANKLDYRWLLLEARQTANWLPPEILEFMAVWNFAEREDQVEKDLRLALGEARCLAGAYQSRYPMLLFKELDFDADPETEAECSEPLPESAIRAINAALRPGTVVMNTVMATQSVTYISPTCMLAAPSEE